MSHARRILVVFESRATYGYSKNVIKAMQGRKDLQLLTLVTGMHLVPELGNSVDLIRRDGFSIDAEVPMHGADDSRSSWSEALGQGIEGFARAFERLLPDIILLSGDRIETFGCCVAAAYMGIPIAHIQAGDISGHIDDAARHAIGKFAHLHLASCEDSANRLRRMGEQEFRIHNVGAPQLDNIVNGNFSASELNVDGNQLTLSEPYILLVQHPVMAEMDSAANQVGLTLQACADTGLPVYVIYPNSDLGYSKIIDSIKDAESKFRITALRNVPRDAYLTLLANASVLVGNSSSGILEAPALGVPVVNIGSRQRRRPQAANILNSGYDKEEIGSSLSMALWDPQFKQKARNAKNPYGDGKSGQRICEILANVNLDTHLMDKAVTY